MNDDWADELGVLRSTAPVVAKARLVRIDDQQVEAAAATIVAMPQPVPTWNERYHFAGAPNETALMTLVLDTLNFSFWGEPRWNVRFEDEVLDGYWALAAALKRAVLTGLLVPRAAELAEMTDERLGLLLAGKGVIPLLAERAAALRELGQVLVQRWQGDAVRFVAAAGGRADRLALHVAAELASFRDVAAYDGREVRFYKRAQIVVADLWGALGGRGLANFSHMDRLTAFADYKVPQVLRRLGVLVYCDELAALVDRRVELAAGSGAEVEIRAATIWGVERLRAALARRGLDLPAFQVDWCLWEAGQRVADDRPYHRTRTIFY